MGTEYQFHHAYETYHSLCVCVLRQSAARLCFEPEVKVGLISDDDTVVTDSLPVVHVCGLVTAWSG